MTWQEVGPHTPVVEMVVVVSVVYMMVLLLVVHHLIILVWMNGMEQLGQLQLLYQQDKVVGVVDQTAGIIMGGNVAKEVQEYNGTSWSEGTSIS